MKKSDIVVATMTWARDEHEHKTLCAALERLSEWGSPIVVSDNGSGKQFVDFITTLPGIEVHQFHRATLLQNIKWSIQSATELANQLNAHYVLYTEPDKQWFFENRLDTFLLHAPDDGVGVLVPARNTESFETFPSFQRYTEGTANELCAELLGEAGDFIYGPLLLSTAVTPYLQLLSEEIGWGWRCFTLVTSHLKGHKIIQVELDLPCPVDQRSEDTKQHRLYRMEQLSQNLQGMLLATRNGQT
ncbi:MAG: hypothetical protein M3441_02865 [Chloroflexota bacterium]|nr:hypothetical protein [Chloroflexota bacterium]